MRAGPDNALDPASGNTVVSASHDQPASPAASPGTFAGRSFFSTPALRMARPGCVKHPDSAPMTSWQADQFCGMTCVEVSAPPAAPQRRNPASCLFPCPFAARIPHARAGTLTWPPSCKVYPKLADVTMPGQGLVNQSSFAILAGARDSGFPRARSKVPNLQSAGSPGISKAEFHRDSYTNGSKTSPYRRRCDDLVKRSGLRTIHEGTHTGARGAQFRLPVHIALRPYSRRSAARWRGLHQRIHPRITRGVGGGR